MLSKTNFFSILFIMSILLQFNIQGMEYQQTNAAATIALLYQIKKEQEKQLQIVPYKTLKNYIDDWNNPHPWKNFIILQKSSSFINPKNQILIEKLIEKYREIRQKDLNETLITHNDINEVKCLWDQLKSLYNYNIEDFIVYPLDQPVNLEDLEKIRKTKPLSLFAHPDKYITNREEINNLYTYLGDTSRPTKSLDFLIQPICRVSHICTSQTIDTIASLPSILFPQYFTNNIIASYKKDTTQEKLEMKRYDNALTKHKIYIKQHETIIKRKEYGIRKKQEEIRDLTKIFSTKKSKQTH